MLLHIDGFDHYGNDETKMTEGIYEEVDPAFSLSTTNPRTGNFSIRHDTTTGSTPLRRSLNGQRTVVGTGMSAYLDQLPNLDNSYVLCDFRDQDNKIQTSVLIESDGSIVVKRGDKSGFTIASSVSGVFTSGIHNHVEVAMNFDTSEESSSLLIDFDHTWEFQNTSGWPTTPDPLTVSIPSSGYSSGDAPFGFIAPAGSFVPTYPVSTTWNNDQFMWLRTTIFADGVNDIRISGEVENAAFFYFDETHIYSVNETNINVDVNTVNIPLIEFTIDKSIATAGLHTLHILLLDEADVAADDNTYFFARYEYVNQLVKTGQVEIRVNGVTVISETSADTTATDNNECSYVSLICGGGPAAHGVTTDIDDWFIWDDLGAWNNSFIGDRRCFLIKPNQDTNIADFEPSSGSFGYKMIDDESPDDDASYIIAEAYLQSGSPLSGTSEFEIEGLSDGTSLISAINVVNRSAKTDSTSAEIFTSINSGADSLSASPHILTTSYKYYSDIYEYDPSTISSLTRDGFASLSVSVTADDLDPGAAFDSPEDVVSPTDEDQTYSEFIISLSPTAYWRLGELSGTAASDEISTNDGTYTNGPLLGQTGLITGDSDTCIRLDGTNDLVDFGNVLNVGTSNFSVVIWYNADTLASPGGQRIIQKRGTGAFGSAAGWMIKISTPSSNGWNETSVDAGDGSYAKLSTTPTAGIDTAAVHMVAITWNNAAESLKLYVDGSLIDTGTVTGTMAGKSISNSRPMTIGCADNGGGSRSQFFDGFADEGAIWIGTDLTDTQISDIYNKGIGL